MVWLWLRLWVCQDICWILMRCLCIWILDICFFLLAEISMCWSSFNQSNQSSEVKAAELCFNWVKLSKNQNFCCVVVQSYDDTKEQSWKVPLISEMVFLTPNRPLIQLWCAQSKLNMDEIYSLNIHLWYVDIAQNFLLKSLHAQKRPFLLLNLQLCAFLCSKSIY